MLPWLKTSRPPTPGVMASPSPIQEEEGETQDMGLRAMAMKAIASDLMQALESRDSQKVAYVLECFAECLVESNSLGE